MPADPSDARPPLRLEWIDPATLTENPANWRRHPEAQMRALGDALDTVGWAGALLWNEQTELLVDGHARLKKALEQGLDKVPVLIGSWDKNQERTILATLDPLAAMAEADSQALDGLLRDLHTGSEALGSLLTSLAEDAGLIPPDRPAASDDFREPGDDDEEEGLKGGDTTPSPEDEYRDIKPVIEYRIIFDDEAQQDAWFAFLKALKAQFPHCDTIGGRLARHVAAQGIMEVDDLAGPEDFRGPAEFGGQDGLDDEDEEFEDDDEE